MLRSVRVAGLRGCAVLALAAAPVAATPVWAQQQDDMDSGVSQAVVQPIPSADTMALNSALVRVAQNPRDVYALVDAGNAASMLGDTDAAIGFFRRAGQIAPTDGRVKAGLAGAMVRNGDPFSAIPLFEEAERAGATSAPMLADRGLAYDLVGDNAKAQGYYRQALARGSSNDALHRLALSLAIANDRRGADGVLAMLQQRQDRSAGRTRTFALAILGQTEESVLLARSTMPPELATAMVPYLRYMRTLTAAQQAAAANLGHFPRASDIGRDDPRIARYAPPKPVALAAAPASPATQSGRNARSRRNTPTPDPRLARAETEQVRRPGSVLRPNVPRAASVERQVAAPARVVVPATTLASNTRQAAVPAALPVAPVPVAAAPAAVAPVATTMMPHTATSPGLSLPLPAPALAVATPVPPVVTSAPTQIAVQAAMPVAAAPSPTPGFASLGSGAAGGEVATFNLGRTATAAPLPAQAPASTAPVVTAAAPVFAAPPVVPQPSRTQSLAEAFSEFAAPAGEASPAPGAVDIRRIRPTREVASGGERNGDAARPGARKPAVPSHPSRIWVQVATGRDKAALAGDWRRMSRQATELLRARKGHISAWGQTNRLLTGPFDTEAAANAFVTQLRRVDIDGAFVWNSPAGQIVDAIGGK